MVRGGCVLGPGEKTPNDPYAKPETYGLPTVFDKAGLVPGGSKVWLCPDQTEQMLAWGNTYANSIASSLTRAMSYHIEKDTFWLWDNYSMRPGLSGFRGSFSGYTISSADRYYPHSSYGQTGYAVTNRLYMSGGVRRQIDVP